MFRVQGPQDWRMKWHEKRNGNWDSVRVYRASFLGVPIIRIIVLWRLYLGPSILGNVLCCERVREVEGSGVRVEVSGCEVEISGLQCLGFRI